MPLARFAHLSHHAAWRRQLELLLDSSGEGFYGVGLDGRCTFINRAGAELLGYTPDEVLGRNMHYLVHHSRGDSSRYPLDECPIMRAFRLGEGCRLDSEVLWRRDGTSFAAEYSSYPIRDGDEIIGAVVTFADITARKQAEAQLEAARDELESRVAARTAELTDLNERLRQSQGALQRLSSHLQTVREEERTRIAREIHDELGASLTALKLDLGWLNRRVSQGSEFAEKLESMTDMVGRALGTVRRIITDLRPGLIDHLGLWAALEWLLQEFQERTGIEAAMTRAQTTDAARLSKPAEIAVYRIVQEVLTNVARHAQARSVTIEVGAEPTGVSLVVRDDGRGMVVPQQPTSFGLLGMYERARGLGGELRIYGQPGRGTAVCLRVPHSNG